MPVFASIQDLQQEARKKLPKPFYDYLENGAFTQTTLAANRTDLDAVKLRERVLGTSAEQAMHCTLVGQPATMPLILAPVGLSGMNRGNGEVLAAEAAQEFGVPYCLSAFSIAAVEDIAASVGGNFWFQLYPMADDQINASLIDRAKKAGCEVLIVTVDCQIEGTRYKDIHNGLGVPPKLNISNLTAFATHPVWCADMLKSPHFTFGNMIGEASADGLSDLAEWVKSALRPTLDQTFLADIRKRWPGKLVIKGILDIADFDIAVEAGADAVIVSNHGGRQLEGGLSTARVLPRIVDRAPPHVEILVDSGIRTGIDILRMLALGAHGCLIGRAYNYGLAADGKAGVVRALEILQDELRRTMALTGVADVNVLPNDLIDASPQ